MTGFAHLTSLATNPALGLLGETWTFEPADGSPSFEVQGIYTSTSAEFSGPDEVNPHRGRPTIGVRTSDFAAPIRRGDVFRQETRAYRVELVPEVFTGFLHLIVNEVD